jgi:hypothetical protein
MTRLGRKPQGVGLIGSLEGSKHAKARLTLFLETLAGQRSVVDACAALGIGESRFFGQRAEWLQAALTLLEPRWPGRPAKQGPATSAEEAKALRQRVQELEARAAVAEVRGELARTLPHVIAHCRPGPGKKTTRMTPRHRAGRNRSPA